MTTGESNKSKAKMNVEQELTFLSEMDMNKICHDGQLLRKDEEIEKKEQKIQLLRAEKVEINKQVEALKGELLSKDEKIKEKDNELQALKNPTLEKWVGKWLDLILRFYWTLGKVTFTMLLISFWISVGILLLENVIEGLGRRFA